MDLTKLSLSVVSINDLNYRIHFWLGVKEDEAIVFEYNIYNYINVH